jgi:hypothetical protein
MFNYISLTTADIKGWEKEDAQRYLDYLHNSNTGLVLKTKSGIVVFEPTGDYFGFTVNDGNLEAVFSNRKTIDIIIDAVACDYRGRLERERREFLRATTGRLDGRPNIADRAEATAARIFFNIFG